MDVDDWFRLVGPYNSVEVFGVRMVGANTETLKKLLFTLILILIITAVSRTLSYLARRAVGGRREERVAFWSRQGIRLAMGIILLLGIVSIWFNDPGRLATFLGLVSAGLAFALQKVVTAFAGYFVILRGKTFNVGDRITMGGVRGDVIALGFIQTTIMEMGQPPAVQIAEPAMWVRARQYTGRIVTVTNDKIFTEPVYNYTRDFPHIWEEISIPVPYSADRQRAERIMLEVAQRHTVKLTEMSEPAIRDMEQRYVMKRAELTPRVFWRITDNWLELTVRFITLEYGVRELKDSMTRQILGGFDEAKIPIASSTFEVVGLPAVKLQG